MALNENKYTVHIEDWVNDIKGSYAGLKDASDKMPAGSNERGYQVKYYPVGDANKSWIYKFTTIVAKAVSNILGDEDVKWSPVKVTKTVYPESAIEGMNKGVSFNNPNNEDDVPERRVILYHDKDGNAPYAEKYAPGNPDTQAKIQELEDKNRDLRQKLDAAGIEIDELENQKEKEEQESSTGNQRNDYFDPMEVMNDEQL